MTHSWFVGADRVSERIKGKRVALVGSGPGCLTNDRGFVDGHEVVVRVNNFKLGSAQGRRTDIFYSFFGTSIHTKVSILRDSGVKLCMAKCPNAKPLDSRWHEINGKGYGVDFRGIYTSRARWWFCDTYVPSVPEFLEGFDLLGQHVPTTGFAALLTLLKNEPKSIYMTGFDFFTSKIHNVNERWHMKNNSDPIGHVPEAELAWLRANIGRLPITADRALRAML